MYRDPEKYHKPEIYHKHAQHYHIASFRALSFPLSIWGLLQPQSVRVLKCNASGADSMDANTSPIQVIGSAFLKAFIEHLF